MQQTTHRYQQVKHYLITGIGRGEWKSGARVPSENQLALNCQVSRMTARKALQALTKQGILVTQKGKGSYVAQETQQSSILQIRSIAAEIKQQGYHYRCEPLLLKKVKASKSLAEIMCIPLRQTVYFSELIHFKQDRPIQLEQRWVIPIAAPEYLKQAFSNITPGEYLTQIAPLTEAEHQIEAIIGEAKTRQYLDIDSDEAIILLKRKTWCNQQLVSYAKLYHPGKRYHFGNKFKPENHSTIDR